MQKKKHAFHIDGVSSSSLMKSDRDIREKKNRISRSEAHHRRKALKREVSKSKRIKRRASKAQIEVPKMYDMETDHKISSVFKAADIVEKDANLNAWDGFTPKILVTTCMKPVKAVQAFIKDIKNLVPHCKLYKRGTYALADIVNYAQDGGFSHVISCTQSHGKVAGMTVSLLKTGVTMHFRVSNVTRCKDIPNRGEWTKHIPELFFKGFESIIGKRTREMLESLFPMKRDYHGRAVVSFLCKRDFIFVRAHRYMFESSDGVAIQELGPRFTLHIKSITRSKINNENMDENFINIEWARAKQKSKREFVT